MPIYEYRCDYCNEHTERLQKLSDPVLTECPHCGKAGLKKLISNTSFRLKGTGWYETDFKNPPKKKETTESKPEESNKTKNNSSSDKDKA